MSKPDAFRSQAQNPAAAALQAAFDRALALHQQGRLAEAERIYGEVLQRQGDHFDALHLLGVIAVQTRRPQRAVELITKAIGLNPKVAAAHGNLGIALQDLKRPLDALASYDKAIALKPDDADVYLNRGNVLRDLQRHAEALASYDRAIALKPDYALAFFVRGAALRDLKRPAEALASYDKAIALRPVDAEGHFNRGNALRELKRHAEAVASYDQAIALRPNHAPAYFNRGNALRDLRRAEEALASYQRAIALRPDYAEAYYNRGAALIDLKRYQDAIACYDRAIALKPDYAAGYNNRGNALRELKRSQEALANYRQAVALKPDDAEAHNNCGAALSDLNRAEEALASFDRAIELKPDYAEAYYNRGNALRELPRHEEALASYEHAIALKPDYADAYNNRGGAQRALKRPEQALASYGRAIALQPDHAEAHLNRAYYLLQLGRFEQGWPEHEWRNKISEPVAVRSYPQPLWLGDEDIADKTLFIHWEQGLGDTIQFSRYAKLAQARGARVVMSVQQPLFGLLQRLGPAIAIVGPREVPAGCDCRCPLLSLPLALRTTLATIPAEPRYLTADAQLRSAWSGRLSATTKPRIGIVWSGSKTHKNDRNRSMGFEQILPMLSVDADWICLQKEIRESDGAALRQDRRVAFFGDDLRDFSDTAALLDLMDLVITVDTGVAHLAGAMGKPVWILLPFNPDWRWLLDRDDSPWYPSARLFRQQRIADWAGVVDRVTAELRSAIGILGAR